MFLKAFASPLAVAAATAVTFGSAAIGQTMVGTHEISDADLPAVTEHCATLASGAEPGMDVGDGNADADAIDPATDLDAPATEDTMDGALPTDGTEGNADADDAATMTDTDVPTDSADGAAGNADADEFSGLNLQEITLADCEAAGLVTAD